MSSSCEGDPAPLAVGGAERPATPPASMIAANSAAVGRRPDAGGGAGVEPVIIKSSSEPSSHPSPTSPGPLPGATLVPFAPPAGCAVPDAARPTCHAAVEVAARPRAAGSPRAACAVDC